MDQHYESLLSVQRNNPINKLTSHRKIQHENQMIKHGVVNFPRSAQAEALLTRKKRVCSMYVTTDLCSKTKKQNASCLLTSCYHVLLSCPLPNGTWLHYVVVTAAWRIFCHITDVQGELMNGLLLQSEHNSTAIACLNGPTQPEPMFSVLYHILVLCVYGHLM